jgi:peptidyl-prolyl cis-trans isomerase D
MLSKMRDHRQNKVMQVIVYSMFGIIIVVFAISFGPGAWGQGGLTTATHAAKVNGTIITATEFERAYGDYLERYRRATGESLNHEQARAMGVRRQILDSLVDRQLVVAHAERLGIQVPDAEVSRTIREIEAFRTDGRFDQELFDRYVRNVLGTSTGRFFERVREDLLHERVLAAVRSGVKVAPGEVWARYVEENDQIDLEYVRLSPVQYRAKATPTDAQVQEVLSTRRDEVEAYYERNAFRYERQERVRARHILISAGDEATEEERAEARSKAESLLERARAGEDFAALAEEHSDDPGSRSRGGDLDWFPRGQMVPPFEQAAFSLEAGEISDVVETPFGFHVIRVEEHQAAHVESLDEVQEDIARDILKSELAKDLARAEAEAILAEARTGRTLADVVGREAEDDLTLELGGTDAPDLAALQAQITRGQQDGLEAATTGLSAIRGGEIRGIGRSADLAAKVMKLTEDAPVVPEVVEVGGALYVVRLVERKRPDPDAFEGEKARLRGELVRSRQSHVEEAFMDALRDEARIQVNEALVSG